MINAIPLFGWFMSIAFSTSLSVPFWFFWSICGIGEKYFYWLPQIYHYISFLNCIGLFVVISILKATIVPKIISVDIKNKDT